MIATIGSAPAQRRRNGQPDQVDPPTVAAPRARRSTTALSLRLGMALACLPVAFFAAAVQLGLARNDATVRTVALDATRGISVAQDIKLNLAELDEIVVHDLLGAVDLGPNGYPTNYDDKRSELADNLVLAASNAPEGAAYRQPLANIDYALAHYHTLVKEAFAADAADDRARASEQYGQAHDVMQGTLLSAADFVDKANTYVLNNTYDTQKARARSTGRLIVISWVALIGFLALAQVLLARKFRRLVNLPLALATVLAIGSGGFALSRLAASAEHLSEAREQAFDSVHVLARAGATVVSARQSEGHLLLDPNDPTANRAFDAETHKLFRVQGRDDLTKLAQAGAIPDGAGGYLAKIAAADMSDAREDSTQRALVAFGDFLAADTLLRQLVASGDVDAATSLYRGGATFDELSDAIAEAQTMDQATFDDHAESATHATAGVDRVAGAAAASVLMLILLGLYLRLREYGS
jgi:hypothetical protein